MIFWTMAWRNLLRQRRRSLMTGLGLAVGFSGVVLLGGYMLRMEKFLVTQGIYLNHVGHIAIYKKDGLAFHLNEPIRYGLSVLDLKDIKETLKKYETHIERQSQFLGGQGIISNGCQSFPFVGLGVESDSEWYTRTHPEVLKNTEEVYQMSQGHGFWEKKNQGIVVAVRLAEFLHRSVFAGDPAERIELRDKLVNCQDEAEKKGIALHSGVQLLGQTFDGGLAAVDTVVTGTYSTGFLFTEAVSLMMPLELAQRFWGTEGATYLSVFLKPGVSYHKVFKHLQKDLETNHPGSYDVYEFKDELVNPFYVGAMGFVYVMNVFFILLVCGIIVLSVLNSMQITLLERKNEIGTLRSLGFSTSTIAWMFVREIGLLCFFSLGIGGAAAIGLAFSVNSMGLRFAIPGFSHDLPFLLKPRWEFALGVGFVFMLIALVAIYWGAQVRLKAKIVSLLEKA